MLIESDHRGETLRLPVSGKLLAVPGHLHIIGMMNTADRGLALIDYALRRRFAFLEMEPALDHPGFLAHLDRVGNRRLRDLVDVVRRLNTRIEENAADQAAPRQSQNQKNRHEVAHHMELQG